MDNGILGLPVHDSVIVQEQHERIYKGGNDPGIQKGTELRAQF
jgi:hypothetical protein